MLELPAWAWMVIGWLCSSVCLVLALARWFRWLRG